MNRLKDAGFPNTYSKPSQVMLQIMEQNTTTGPNIRINVFDQATFKFWLKDALFILKFSHFLESLKFTATLSHQSQ